MFGSLRLIGTLFILLTLCIVGLIAWYRNSAGERVPAQTHAQSRPVPPKAELQAFWNEHCKSIEEFIMAGSFRIPEIAQRRQTLSNLIALRYGSNLRVHLVSNYHRWGPRVGAACGEDAGVPSLDIIVPHAFDAFVRFRMTGLRDWQERLEMRLVIEVIHELDHLAYGYLISSASLDAIADNERRAWAQTCEHTLSILVERYHAPIDEGDRLFYLLWVESGRDVNSPRWIQGVREAHADLKR